MKMKVEFVPIKCFMPPGTNEASKDASLRMVIMPMWAYSAWLTFIQVIFSASLLRSVKPLISNVF
jgi:hypothetical protein